MEIMPFNDISHLEFWQPFCSVEKNHLCNFDRGCYEEQFCEIISILGQKVQEKMWLKRFLIWSSGSPPDMWSEPIYAILKEGIIGNIHVKLFEIWTSCSGGDVV